MEELIHDNGHGFGNTEFANKLSRMGIRSKNTSPIHPSTNGKCERFNGQLKQIIKHLISAMPLPFVQLQTNATLHAMVIDKAIRLYNSTPNVFGYSPNFLMFGCEITDSAAKNIPELGIFSSYEREMTEEEEEDMVKQRVRANMDTIRHRDYVNSGKACRDEVRAMLQEKKALYKTFEKGDWVLRTRERRHKLEPFYDGPFQIVKSLPQQNYSLSTPGGEILKRSYHADRLFPAYTMNKQPIRSLWYASKPMLEKDRKRLKRQVGE